ncbi:MAG: RIP metalloprotease RseP [Patescibacteria group bacterium]|nr:RIP metalloprotease RseP [Patescibacteria group bacterium]
MTTLLATIFVLGVLIFIHEFGHFIIAKLSGIRVERFSLGFPPRAWGFIRGDTDYCISWIPLGGYCKMAGMVDESMDISGIKGEPWEFQSKSNWIKSLVILAGPGMNILLAAFIFILLALILGVSDPSPESRIGQLTPDFPAAQAGMKQGDLVVEVNGQKTETWEQLTNIIHNLPEQTITVTWLREGISHTAEIRTNKRKIPVRGEIQEVGLIGIEPVMMHRAAGIGEAIWSGFSNIYYITKLIVASIKLLVTGEESLKSLGGPIMIAKMAGDSARSGIWALLSFMALISLNLGLLNLLPIPVLDGGHLVFIGIESIIRRPLPIKAKLIIQQVGMALILLLTLFVIYNDVVKLFNWSN